MTNLNIFRTRCSRIARAFARPELMIAMLIIGAALATPSIAMLGDTVADRVLGQTDFVHNGLNLIDATGTWTPQSVAIDSSVTPNRLYVSDTGNSRVLGYKNVATFVSGGAADLVIGQPDFQSGACNRNGGVTPARGTLCGPVGIAVDAGGNLYVADSLNSRLLEYSTPFAGCGSFPCVGGSANSVFGQGGNFTTSSCDGGGVSASSLCHPVGVAVDSNGNVFISDQSDNRVLEYNTPLTTNTIADFVLGQGGSFSSTAANQSGVNAFSLNSPEALAVDSSNDLYVADARNNRVLEYFNPLTSAQANNVFGQNFSFASNAANNGGESANSLDFPVGVAVDSSGDLYIADSVNNRVLEYNAPLNFSATANHVFGQGGSFASSACNNDTGNSAVSSANDLCLSSNVAGQGGRSRNRRGGQSIRN